MVHLCQFCSTIFSFPFTFLFEEDVSIYFLFKHLKIFMLQPFQKFLSFLIHLNCVYFMILPVVFLDIINSICIMNIRFAGSLDAVSVFVFTLPVCTPHRHVVVTAPTHWRCPWSCCSSVIEPLGGLFRASLALLTPHLSQRP